MEFRKLHQDRKKLLRENKENDFVLVKGEREVMISAPHGVVQTRLGKSKFPEKGSLATAFYLAKKTNSYFIAKTKNNFDDANFDENCPYKDEIDRLATMGKIRYLLDFHGLAAFRECDINLGTNFEHNTEKNSELLNFLISLLKEGGFSLSCDTPFKSGPRTIAGYIKNRHKDMWTIQIEINCKITNQKENFDKFKKLIEIFERFIQELN